jgi:hypothetical protein
MARQIPVQTYKLHQQVFVLWFLSPIQVLFAGSKDALNIKSLDRIPFVDNPSC